jgi:hypothetical protein
MELNSEMHLEAEIEQVWRCIWRPRSSNSKIHLEAEIMLNSEMHLEVVIERVWRWCNSEMHLEAVIERVWRYTWRPRSSELRAALGGRDRASLEIHLEAEIE